MNATTWSRHTVPNTVAGMRGHTNYMMQYKGYEVVLEDEGYNKPAWTIIFRKLTTVHVQRYFTEFMPLQYAKLKAIDVIDERELKDQRD